jgi:hypothetical protein
MYLLEKLGLEPLVRLPEQLRRDIFARSGLDLDQKLVLAGLYYLDSVGRLDAHEYELPDVTSLDAARCRECLAALAEHGLITYTEARVRLRVKPLTYGSPHAQKD